MTDGVADENPWRRRIYADPPVVESMARLAWQTPVRWNTTTPGVLYERVRSLYPEEPQARAVMQASFAPAQGGSSPAQGGFQFTTDAQRIAYSAEDGSRLLSVGPTDIAVHGLRPYEGWESLEQRLFEAVDLVKEPLVGEQPFMVDVAGLRYVNRVEIAEPTIEFRDYLTIEYTFPDSFPPQMSGFLERAELFYEDEPVRMAFTFGGVPAEPGHAAFVLDLDYYHEPPQSISLDDARLALQDLKRREGQAFESLLQDKLREEFREIEA